MEADRAKRETLILAALLERRVAVEEETRRIRADLSELVRREGELRSEIATLDAILGAMPEPRKETEPPSLFSPAPREEATARTVTKRRRRKGSRRVQMLPKLRERFRDGAFTTDEVTNLILEEEPGERRKAYYAAWSLCRDLEEDGVIAVVAEEGSGRRTKKTFKFAEPA